jgi:hypothetical protein
MMNHAPRVACLTMVKNDPEFVDIWARYYAGLFGAEHCYIIDHGSDEMAGLDRARAMGAQVIRLPHTYPAHAPEGRLKNGAPVQFDRYRFSFLSKQRVALREFYDIVILHDVDEVLLADPAKYTDLADYIAKNAQRVQMHDIMGGMGVEIFHDPNTEAAYDPAQPVLGQRRQAHFRLPECKPAIFQSDEPGRAHSTTIPFALDADLWLLHLKFLDRDRMFARQHQRHAAVQRGEVADWTRWGWAANEVDDKFHAFINRPTDPDDSRGRAFLARHFRTTPDGAAMVEKHPDGPGPWYQANAGLKGRGQDELHGVRFVIPDRYLGLV